MKAGPWEVRCLPCESARGLETIAQQERRNSNCVELERTRTPQKMGGDTRLNPMNYEERSKSIELERTLTPNFVVGLQWDIGEEF